MKQKKIKESHESHEENHEGIEQMLEKHKQTTIKDKATGANVDEKN